VTAENRVLALQYAIEAVAKDGNLPATEEQAAAITTVAQVFWRWLDGPAVLFLTVDPETFDQAAPEGPGTPTIRKGNTVQITDTQQYTATVGEQDSKAQPVTGDNLAWTIDNPAVATLTPAADGYSALIVGVADGTAGYTVTDSTVNPPLTGTGSVTVVSSAATSLVISEGTAEDQPPAAPPSA
jgi:hypothetical protein